MKLIISAALVAATFGLTFAAPVMAGQLYEPVCTTAPSYDPPSGTYVAPDGRKWAGFNADGTPPESLATGNSETNCEVEPG